MNIKSNFVTLQFVMNARMLNISALLLVLWYSLSVIGFNVHTCNRSGERYIATVIGGTTCEDIHPEHIVKSCPCCHHEDKHTCQSLDSKSCCTDDWQMIELTGVKISEGQDSIYGYICELSHNALSTVTIDNSFKFRLSARERASYKPDSGKFRSLDYQEIYNIWRI